MPNTSTDPRVKVPVEDASISLTDNVQALFTLSRLLDGYGETLDDDHCYGIAQIVKLIAADLYDKVGVLNDEVLVLKGALKDKGADHE